MPAICFTREINLLYGMYWLQILKSKTDSGVGCYHSLLSVGTMVFIVSIHGRLDSRTKKIGGIGSYTEKYDGNYRIINDGGWAQHVHGDGHLLGTMQYLSTLLQQ